MKVFRLGCSRGHDFEGWFGSAEDFARQSSGHEIRCPLCEDSAVTRLPAAPYVNRGARRDATLPVAASGAQAPANLATALAALKAYVVANTEDVGQKFPEVSRKIHYGEESPRGIRGRATAEEAAELQDEGIEVVVLPPVLALDEKVH